MNQFSLSPTSRRDLNQIYDYIARDNPLAAVRFVGKVEQKCRQLAESPESGFARDDLAPGLRAWPVAKYVIPYRIMNGALDIVRIVHGARDLGALFE